jgi:hypothetical protein
MKHRPGTEAFAVISEESMIPLCKKYGIDFVMHENEPVGRKKNFGLTYAMKKDFDYLIELGSDDVILNSFFDYYDPFLKAGDDYFVSNKLIFVDIYMTDCRKYEALNGEYGRGWGLGRCMSRRLLESFRGKVKVKALTGLFADGEVVGEGSISYLSSPVAQSLKAQGFVEVLDDTTSYYLWTDTANRMLDNDSSYRIESKGFKLKIVESDEFFMADLKSDENIWAYNHEIGKKGDLEKFLKGLTQAERSAFFATQKKLKARRIERAA